MSHLSVMSVHLICQEARAFYSSKGFTSLPQVLVNGVQLDLEENLETALVTQMQYQTFEIQQALFNVRWSQVLFFQKPCFLSSRIN